MVYTEDNIFKETAVDMKRRISWDARKYKEVRPSCSLSPACVLPAFQRHPHLVQAWTSCMLVGVELRYLDSIQEW